MIPLNLRTPSGCPGSPVYGRPGLLCVQSPAPGAPRCL